VNRPQGALDAALAVALAVVEEVHGPQTMLRSAFGLPPALRGGGIGKDRFYVLAEPAVVGLVELGADDPELVLRLLESLVPILRVLEADRSSAVCVNASSV